LTCIPYIICDTTLVISGADPLNNGKVQNVHLLATRWQLSR